MTLSSFFLQNPRIALAFSGGVDSSYLLYAAMRAGCDVHAFFVKTAFQPQFELDDALRLAKELDVPLTILYHDVFAHPQVVANPPDRCYYCKHALFQMMKEEAEKAGYPVLMDGTNASDNGDDRPGMKALTELSVRSPLRECGITKAEIYSRSKKAGLFTHDKPSYACLATRIPAGTSIDAQTLQRVEKAEEWLFSLGFSNLRVRVQGHAAKIQLPADQLVKAAIRSDEIRQGLGTLFDDIWLDLAPREFCLCAI